VEISSKEEAPKKNYKMWIIVGVIIIALLIGGYFMFFKTKQVVRIGHLPITDHLILGVSQERDGDSFRNLELEPVKFKDWGSLVKELKLGNLDGAFILAPLAMKTELEGAETEVVLLGHRDGSALMIQTKSDINTASDFKDKTIAIPHVFSIHNVLLHKIVTEAGLDYENDVNVIIMAPSDMPTSLMDGEIDGYIVAEPFGVRAEEYGYGKIFVLSKDVWGNHICCIFVVRKEFLNENPRVVQELVNSFVRSAEFIEQNPDEAASIGRGFLGQPKKTIYAVLTNPVDRVSYKDLTPDEKDFNEVQDYIVNTMGIADKKINIYDWIETKYAQEAYTKIK